MLLVTYDITSDTLRTKFSRFLEKFGDRVQCSVFQIKNSERYLKNIRTEIEGRFQKKFKGSDSVLIFFVCEGCKKRTLKFGFNKSEESDIVVIG